MFSDQLDESLHIFQQFAEGDPKDWQAQLYIARSTARSTTSPMLARR